MLVMNYKGFKAEIMSAERLTGTSHHSLPPGTPINVYPVDEFKQPLQNWIPGPGNYVVPVNSNLGLWFCFCKNDHLNTSVLLSIKGMNPITGQRTNGFSLERYEEKCPVHGTLFKEGLFCEECNYKWPDQNYIAYPNTLWWDGFRSADGNVRQFFFTEDLARSIPELVIGKEDTVPAFGFAFFKPKIRREYPVIGSLGFTGSTGSKGFTGVISNNFYGSSTDAEHIYDYCCCDFDAAKKRHSPPNIIRRLYKRENAEVGVGAGAIINQKITIDPLKISDWEDKPSSVMRLYFIFIEQFNEIKSRGMKDIIGDKEGFLSQLPVG